MSLIVIVLAQYKYFLAGGGRKIYIYSPLKTDVMYKYQWILLGAIFLISSISFFIASVATFSVVLGWVVYGAFGMAFFALAIASWTMYVVEADEARKSRRKRNLYAK